MDAVGKPPQWMERHLEVYAAHLAHKFCADRLRRKLVADTSAETLLVEAFEMVRREIGPFPSEDRYNDPFPDDDDEATERAMREIATSNYDSLTETESYMWGLGIAGLIHQWERDTRRVISSLAAKPPALDKLEKMDFRELCKNVRGTGFDIEHHSEFGALRRACLIANTIKHGLGKSFRLLASERPDLFPGGPNKLRDKTRPPAPQDLRVSAPEFDDAARAIDEIWDAYESAALR